MRGFGWRLAGAALLLVFASLPRALAAEELSDERSHSVWAFVEQPVDARADPSYDSAVVKRLRLSTPDGPAEVVLALKQLVADDGTTWVLVRLPTRPNGTTGWVPRQALGEFQYINTYLRLDTARFRAVLFRGDRVVWKARIGVGKRRWPTPKGHFYVREKLKPKGNGVYGVFAFGTSAYSDTISDWPGGGIIGIHGTNQPQLIPGRISHGCIRVTNTKIRRLRRLMPLGTPIEIL